MPASRRTYLRRRIVVFGTLGVLLAGLGYLPMALLAPLTPATSAAITTTAPENPPVELAWPGYGASAIGAVGFPGILATGGSTELRTIASITKIVTSLVSLDAKPLGEGEDGPTITLTSADAALYHKYFALRGKVEPVRAGLQLTERQLLTVTLVSSANNYAESLATWAYGSEGAFLSAARTWLDAHGLSNTTLLDSTGMNPGNTSTASDLVELGRIALADPVVSSIVRMSTATLPYIGTIHNTNELLGVDGINGIKTGTLDEAGACLLFSASITVADSAGSEHPIDVVGVILSGPGHDDHDVLDAAVRKLLASAVNGFREVSLVNAGDAYYVYSTPWEQSARAVATKDESVLVWAGRAVTETAAVDPLLTGEAGQEVGSVTFTVGDRTVTVPLALDTALEGPGLWWRLTHPFG
ncbi:hypothetical protein GCM10022239_20690 [Leifsonia bigeumensis]|uniref:Peptidase S11 D-alanyl-D-alanine carboxypeptidase A N-terminal domain-containing protein n=1 Tax=Leifsonella bigeumensis TaxID=433643 RepID=A0ABP7FRX1_9MICO